MIRSFLKRFEWSNNSLFFLTSILLKNAKRELKGDYYKYYIQDKSI